MKPDQQSRPRASTPQPRSVRRQALGAGFSSTVGTLLLGASAASLGCSAATTAEDEALLALDDVAAVAQAATCTPVPVKKLSLDFTQQQNLYPGAAYHNLRSPSAINDSGQVMASMSVVDANDVGSFRGLRWNVGTNEVQHMGLLANVRRSTAYQGWPNALNASGHMVGNSQSCLGENLPVIWRGSALFSDRLFALERPAEEASALTKKTFCDESAKRSDMQALTERVPGAHMINDSFGIALNDQGVAVGRLNAKLGGASVASGGLVVIDAEGYSTRVANSTHAWYPETGGGMRAVPDSGININTGFATSSPRLDYQVRFQTAGTYTVWVKGSGPNGDSDSLHVGVDGVANTTADRLSGFGTTSRWSKATLDGANATISVSTPGLHTINVWMREDGMLIDKILLTTSTAFTPVEEEPALSLREGEDSKFRQLPFKWNASTGATLLPCVVGTRTAPTLAECPETFFQSPDLNDSFGFNALVINNLGQVITRENGYFWDTDNTLTDIGLIKTQAINNQGLVVGTWPSGSAAIYVAPDGTPLNLGLPGVRGFVWSKGSSLVELSTHANGDPAFRASPITTATAVNDRGEVAGISMVGTDFHAYVWTAATGMVDRGSLGHYSGGLPEVVDINERGELLINGADGAYFDVPGVQADPVRIETADTHLPIMSQALGLNNNSQVVGFSQCTNELCKELSVWQPDVCVEDINPVYLEAECATTTQGAYATLQTSRSGYSGNGHLISVANTTANPFNNTSLDRASYAVNIATAGNYTVYFRAHGNANANDDSWFYQVDNGTWITMNNSTLAGWNWYAGNGGAVVNLSAGAHTIRIANRENGLGMDKLALIPQGAAAPVGIGGTAANCAAPTPSFPIFSATFDNYAAGNTDFFLFDETAFQSPSAFNGQTNGIDVGQLNVTLGLNPSAATTPNSAAYGRTFQLSARSTVTVNLTYSLTMADAFEAAECGEVRVKIGNTYYGTGGNTWVTRRCDGGNSAGSHQFTTAPLAAGSYTLQVGGYLNDNSAADEIAIVRIDNVAVTGRLAP